MALQYSTEGMVGLKEGVKNYWNLEWQTGNNLWGICTSGNAFHINVHCRSYCLILVKHLKQICKIGRLWNQLYHQCDDSLTQPLSLARMLLTHWGPVTHICVRKLTTIRSDNGADSGRRQAIIWTNAGILLVGTLGTNFSEILIAIHTFSFTKMH